MAELINKICRWIFFAIFVIIGICIGRSVWQCWDYVVHPGLYAIQSAPWYTGILVNCGATVIFVALLSLIRCGLLRYGKKRKLSKDAAESRKNH